MSKDTLRFLFRQLADAINFRHDVPAQWFVQSVFDIEEAAASTLELPPLDAFFRFDGRLVALRGVELLGRLAIDNPWNPFATLGVVKLQEPATQPEFVRYVDNDAVVVEKISGDWSVHPKVYYRGFVWNLQHVEVRVCHPSTMGCAVGG
ncbi:MAG: hypothetical protein KatS3mg110_4106 [Pirellulaceae bacterium]|nr:MAG: hypothetical protein KatS3mg110_4106 [Pirellulaceae bacterium]